MTNKMAVVLTFLAVRWGPRARSRSALEARQRRLWRRQGRYFASHSAYFAGLDVARRPLASLPLMSKGVMMDNFDVMNTLGVARDAALDAAIDSERTRDFSADFDGASVGLSSGTSGHRGLFVVSAAERAQWAGTMLARTLPPHKILGNRIALFLRADNTLYESVASRAVEFRYFDLYGDMEAHVDELADFSPSILVGPPSVLAVIAEIARTRSIHLRPTRVFSVAEVLEPGDGERLAAAFGVSYLHQIYQCTEGFLGVTCVAGVMHLNERDLIVERDMLDDERFVPIVTDLRRRAQPIVRYRMGDVLRLRTSPCPCGDVATAIERIEGREGDTLSLAPEDPTRPRVRVFADLAARAIVHADGISEYRVVQTEAQRWRVELDPLTEESRGAVRTEIAMLAERLHARVPELEFVAFTRDLTRKLRRVENAWHGKDIEGER